MSDATLRIRATLLPLLALRSRSRLAAASGSSTVLLLILVIYQVSIIAPEAAKKNEKPQAGEGECSGVFMVSACRHVCVVMDVDVEC